MSASTAKLLLSLEDAFSSGELGNKAVSLGRLLRDGLPVPRGVVIPDCALQRHLVRCGASEDVDALLGGLDRLERSEIRDTSRRIRERIEATQLHQALRDELVAHYTSHWPGKVLAVRSSAAAEDSLHASFAGQLDSFLDIDSLAGVEAAIRRTWASLWSERSLLYARQKGLRPRCMGVILQEQVDARLSGVLFTRDPMDPQSDWMLAEYCKGLGAALVSGTITPASLHIARHDLGLRAGPRSPRDPDLEPVYRHGLQAIARMALEIEVRGAVPQDIEWSIDGTGAPWLLQARPISMAARQQAPAPVQVHWSNANIAENFPEPVSPFLYSLVKPGYTAYFRNLALGFGLSRKRIDRMSAALEDLVGLHAGRLYYNLTNIHTVLRLAPGGRWLVRSFNLFVGAAEIPETSTAAMGRAERVGEALRILARTTWQYLWIQSRVRRFERRVDEFADQTRPELLPARSTDDLRRDLQRFLDIRLGQWNDAALADAAAMVCYGLLKAQLAGTCAVAIDVGLHNDLLKGLPGLASAEPVMKLWELSQALRDSPDLQALFGQVTSEDDIGRAVESEGQRFPRPSGRLPGSLGLSLLRELMLTTPTPHENPRPVLRLLQAYLLARQATSPEAHEPQVRPRHARRRRQRWRLA